MGSGDEYCFEFIYSWYTFWLKKFKLDLLTLSLTNVKKKQWEELLSEWA